MAKISEIEITKLLMDEGAAPGTPAATNVALYAKADGLLYSKDDAGAETLVSGGAGGGLGAWTDFTPVLTGSGSNPVLGSSTLTGRYKALDANTYCINIALTVTTGGAWSAGTGDWIFSLPSVTSAAYRQTLACHISDTGTRRFVATGVVGASGTTIGATGVADASGTFTLGATIPITWATGDYVLFSGIIEVA